MGSGYPIGKQLKTNALPGSKQIGAVMNTDGSLPTPDSPEAGPSWATDDAALFVQKATLTTDGDLYYRANGVITRLPIGTANQVLTVGASGLPGWAAGGGGGGGTTCDFKYKAATGSGMQTVVAATWTKLTIYTTQVYNDGATFASSKFTCTTPGVHHFDARVIWGAAKQGYIAFYVNAVQEDTDFGSSPGDFNLFTVSADFKLAINDTVEVYVFVEGGGTTFDSQSDNRFSGHLVR